MVIELNIVILLCVTGAVLLAAIFHSILFYYFRTRLISSYALYLWMVFLYAMFRLAYYYHDLPDLYFLIHPDEALQMLSFIFYVRFIGIALEINPRKERRPYMYVKATPYVIAAYIVINGILLWWQKQHEDSGPNLVLLPYIFIRVYLLFIGFYFLSVVNKKRHETYFRLIFWGASCIIFFGLASTVYEYFGKIHHILSPLSVLFMGFFTDILFFSAAISNRLHRENIEKERVKRSLLQRELEVNAARLENLEAIYTARNEERKRISAELHDDIGSGLTRIAIMVELIKKNRLQQGNADREQDLDKISTTSRELIDNLQQLIWALNPRNDTLGNFVAYIREYTLDFFEPLGVDVICQFPDEIPETGIFAEQRRNLFLVIKESLNNIAKHACCHQVTISISCTSEKLSIDICDDGKGFDLNGSRRGNGLINMQNRIEHMGGHYNIDSATGQGSKTRIVVPMFGEITSTP